MSLAHFRRTELPATVFDLRKVQQIRSQAEQKQLPTTVPGTDIKVGYRLRLILNIFKGLHFTAMLGKQLLRLFLARGCAPRLAARGDASEDVVVGACGGYVSRKY
jgi:hypothetical protein